MLANYEFLYGFDMGTKTQEYYTKNFPYWE